MPVGLQLAIIPRPGSGQLRDEQAKHLFAGAPAFGYNVHTDDLIRRSIVALGSPPRSGPLAYLERTSCRSIPTPYPSMH